MPLGERNSARLLGAYSISLVILILITISLGFYIYLTSQNTITDIIALIAAFSSIILALTTVVTLIENRRISQQTIDIANKSLEETRLMRESQIEPSILVRIHLREECLNLADLIIENVGLGPAYDVQFKIVPSMDELMGTNISNMGFVKRGLNCLASGQTIQFFLTDLADRYDEKANAFYTVDVGYKNSIGKPYHSTHIIDFSELEGFTQLGTPPMYEMANALRDMQRDIRNMSTDFSNIKVVAYIPELAEKSKE